ncbi:MAG: TetR/AcrR family transcriptional regulator [Lactobacillus sp.]|uniref:TetR/AcrR family transcriptional regulator n=1 Tax=Lacticaseibacillus suilingensis TaxID=2799577 RepID=A0ABW4BEI6_9LACO|nr:TetR/AcrR family transcriptional regulator [Lacticaseibacillus suilingensis]MCI1894259.1 TetR/AcrR family transcriptional regulator [Lactobacillus sp.]MCI1916896.1 TetR/AcrR family transcriptional regulator [Lactobacillus sp.]MCI1942100.1 TetR/AcrR family transcriptional regulator [Lactobacillus sp.]MCI1972437.1 TetR/AcrR family transcriptional regulator [Lactobacillus sp.]MCI2017022.1 TetR/AcrR family transcriptional regulator [Lactobacillus sp.]
MTDKSTRRVQQVDQSLAWFQQALVQLLEQEPYPKITVSALATRAGLSRRTFYRHYESIDQVLNQLIAAEVAQLFKRIQKARPQHFQEVVEVYFDYWQAHLGFLRSLATNHLLPQLLTALTQATHDSLLAKMFPQTEPYIYAFAAGGVWNLMVAWLQNGATDTPEVMAQKARLVAKHLVAIM